MPLDPPQQYAQGAGNGLQDTLNKQMGPLKAWQWGVAVGGAVLLYFVIRGRSSGGSSTGTTVPFTSGSDPNTPSGQSPVGNADDPLHVIVDQISPDAGGGTPPAPVPTFIKKLIYTSAKVLHTAPIVDKTGKVVGHLTSGRTILLGARVKINGKWLYPILNMPGKYVGGGSNFKLTPVYDNVPAAGLATSMALAAPVTTLEASASQLYQPSASNNTIAPPTALNGYQISTPSMQLPTASN